MVTDTVSNNNRSLLLGGRVRWRLHMLWWDDWWIFLHWFGVYWRRIGSLQLFLFLQRNIEIIMLQDKGHLYNLMTLCSATCFTLVFYLL